MHTHSLKQTAGSTGVVQIRQARPFKLVALIPIQLNLHNLAFTCTSKQAMCITEDLQTDTATYSHWRLGVPVHQLLLHSLQALSKQPQYQATHGTEDLQMNTATYSRWRLGISIHQLLLHSLQALRAARPSVLCPVLAGLRELCASAHPAQIAAPHKSSRQPLNSEKTRPPIKTKTKQRSPEAKNLV
eukprot:1142168-Pelagomonas_calceolata.AAC.2